MTAHPIARFKTLPESAAALLNRLIEPIEFADQETAIGLVFVQGSGLRIGMLSGEDIKQMSPARARRLAGELDDANLAELAPISAALREKADALDVLTAEPKGSA